MKMVQERPVKSLGNWYMADLNDKQSVRDIIQVDTWMTEKSGLPGKYKAWGYQHGVVPRLLWPLLVYEVSVSTVEGLERKINTYLRRWLVAPRSFCFIGLNSTGSKLQLPVTSVLEEYKATKTCQAIMLRDSKDERVCQAGIVVRTGCKCSVTFFPYPLAESADEKNLNIFSSATSSSDSCPFLSDTVSKPYSMAGLTTVLYTFPLILADIF
ncbi:hypothetical protein QTP86_011630 [Hemibagrus guttatus]|nr:hypothetical protein QTP86_011630 [Hemibagrus guttatus]